MLVPNAPGHHEPQYAYAVATLTQRFAGVFTGAEVESAVREARAELEPQSTVHDFLELLVERRAKEALLARSARSVDPELV